MTTQDPVNRRLGPDLTRPALPDRLTPPLELVEAARTSLVEASRAPGVRERYLHAQLAALRAAAALVAVRGTADGSGPHNLWHLLVRVAPELVEWADFFSRSTARRGAVDRGIEAVSGREADDLLRQADTFVGLVVGTLGLPRRPTATLLAPVSPASLRPAPGSPRA